MVSKCANPNCSTPFHHRRGRLFRFPKQPVEGGHPANTHSVQHFWLCEACLFVYSLEYYQGQGVTLRRHFETALEANSRKVIAQA
jgi:hypothetical protein